MRLVADIGGTNSRLALADSGHLRPGSSHSFRNAEFPSFEAVVAAYFRQIGDAAPAEIVLAVAGPIDGDQARLTNRGWEISASALAARLGAGRAQIINDLVALGYAVPNLGPDALDAVVGGDPEPGTPRQSLVVGIGTGFNVSPVIQNGETVICLRSEIGHAGLPAGVAQALETRQTGLANSFPTIEHCFSGRGFAEVCRSMTDRAGVGPEEFIQIHDLGEATDVIRAVEFYAELIGSLLRELTLAYLPTSGVYFAGSVARSVLSRPSRGRFQKVIARSFRIRTHESTPVFTIIADNAALHGCARMPLIEP